MIDDDPNITPIAASSTTAHADMLFALIATGGAPSLVRVDRDNRSYQTLPLPASVSVVEQIIGRPSDTADGVLFLRDADKKIFRGICNPSSEACTWSEIGTGDVIRGDWAVGRAAVP